MKRCCMVTPILARNALEQALPRTDHMAVSTKVLGRIRVVRPELHPDGYYEAAIKQVRGKERARFG